MITPRVGVTLMFIAGVLIYPPKCGDVPWRGKFYGVTEILHYDRKRKIICIGNCDKVNETGKSSTRAEERGYVWKMIRKRQ